MKLTPLTSPAEFAAKVKRIRVRVTIPGLVLAYGPKWTGEIPAIYRDVTTYTAGVPELVKEELEKKGYAVTFNWENPWSYGPRRPCLLETPRWSNPADGPQKIVGMTPDPVAGPCRKPNGGYRGYLYQMSQFSEFLGTDEAFIELGTISLDDSYTTSKTFSTETETARVTDASGNTVGRVYEPGQTTKTETHEEVFASATMQVFIHGRDTSVLSIQAWSEKTKYVGPLVRQVLAEIPARK